MRKQAISLIAFLAIFVSSNLFAATRWTDAGTDNNWTTASNWDSRYGNAPPLPSDTTYIRYVDLVAGGQGPVIANGMHIEIKMLALEAATGYISLEITGGSLYCNQNSGGDGVRLGAGTGSGLAVMYMSGGTLTTHDQIRIGSGYPGRMYLSGSAAIYTGKLWIALGTGLLDISSEQSAVYILGDHTVVIQTYLNEGRITAFGGSGTLRYDFDQTLPGYTAIQAIPEPTEPIINEWNGQGADRLWTTGKNWSTGSMPANNETTVSIKELDVGSGGPVITANMMPPPGYETLTARGIRFEPPDWQTTVMTIEGGSLRLREELWLIAGMSKGRAILEMYGGDLEIGTELRIGRGGSRGGHVQLNGGTIQAQTLTIRTNGTINLRGGGKLILDSDVSTSIKEAVDAGAVMAYNGTGQVLIQYNSAEDKTVVSAQMLSKEASLKVKVDTCSAWSIDQLLWGRFFEHHGSDVYPGIYEQYIVNTSFEPWYHKDANSPTPIKDIKEWLVFRNIEETEGVAYPWEPFGSQYSSMFALSSDSVNSGTSQKIVHTDEEGVLVGVAQRIMLPDYRTDHYIVRLFAKAEETVEEIEILLRDYGTESIVDCVLLPVSSQWQPIEGLLNLRGHQASSKRYGRQGIYELAAVIRNPGKILIDQMTVFPVDAVDGRYNPETIEILRKAGVTTIRWPGGNFASGYHWQDGIGPLEERPTRPNLAWAGLENNHVGTDEFLEFCELAGLTPIICVGFGYTSVEEAAAWVEYVNGCPDTTYYGALRAQNGRQQPYAVEIWQVGNEVYGSYQIGHTDAVDYATRYLDYYDAMKAVDPTIRIMAMGRDPGYHTDDDNAWNKTLFEIIGDRMDFMDIHRYVRGLRNVSDLEQWDLTGLSEIYLGYPTQYERVILDSIRQLTKPEQYNLPNLKLAVTEWAQDLTVWVPCVPHRWSQANAVFYAGMMNVFLRNSDFVNRSCSHDFSAFINSREVPPSPRNAIAQLYNDVGGDRLLETEVVCDTFDMEQSVPQMQTITDIPYVDAAAVKDADKNQMILFLVNRSLTSRYDVEIEMEGISNRGSAILSVFSVNEEYMDYTAHCMAPQTWDKPRQFQIRTEEVLTEAGILRMSMPSCSVAKIVISDLAYAGFSVFADQWLQDTCSIGNQWCKGADFDKNGSVNIHDLAACAQNWLWIGWP